ncbi:MAG TPA: hypothetical protein V6C65_26000 [Allocoleopsis sp.]
MNFKQHESQATVIKEESVMKRNWRLFWVLALLLLWLFCSGTAQADTLSERLAQFPEWHGKPMTQVAKGDLEYPEWFAGDWTVTTTLIDMAAPLAPDLVTPGFEGNRKFLNQPITFQVRFVDTEPTLIQSFLQPIFNDRPKPVIADRAYNGLNLAKAYLGDRGVLAVKVDPTNPNRQITLFRDNRELVSTITTRITEAPNAEQFFTSEVFQQEFLGAPEIYFNEVENTTAYTRQSNTADKNSPLIVADQVTAIFLSPQDPDYFKAIDRDSLFGDPRPVALYRYRMEFSKTPDQG